MRKEITAALPELSFIQENALREKVIDVWEEALGTGGFSLWDLKNMPFTLLADNVSVTFLEHVRAVCQMCVGMADVITRSYGKRVPLNKDVLIAGALLADIGKMIEFEKRADGSRRKGHKGTMLPPPLSGAGRRSSTGSPTK